MRLTLPHLSHVLDRQFLARANEVVLLGVLWGALLACVVGALVFDLNRWLAD